MPLIFSPKIQMLLIPANAWIPPDAESAVGSLLCLKPKKFARSAELWNKGWSELCQNELGRWTWTGFNGIPVHEWANC
jgi:hypothetical protein